MARILVLVPDVLGRLDRVHAVVIDEDLLHGPVVDGEATDDPDARLMLTAARDSNLDLHVASADAAMISWAAPAKFFDREEELAHVRRLQAEGRGVCYIGAADRPGLAAADVSIGVRTADKRPPWEAHVVCGNLRQARVLVESIALARRASEHSVRIAMAEAIAGLLVSVGGLRTRTVRQIITASNGASLLSMLNALRLARSLRFGPSGPRTVPAPWHAMEARDALRKLGSSERGLSSDQAGQRREDTQPPVSRSRRWVSLVIDELENPLTPVLIGGAGLSAISGGVVDALMIGGVVAFNCAIGATQRQRTEVALAALEDRERRLVRVFRDGKCRRMSEDELVAGDVFELDSGEVVPADGRLIVADRLEMDESSLTGESMPVRKRVEPSVARAVADRRSMIYEGTTLAAGRAIAVVTAVGPDTEAQRALYSVQLESDRSGVEQRLESLTSLTIPVAGFSGAVMAAAGLARGASPADVISSGVSLTVAAVPEGLPLLATIAQLAAAQRLQEIGALVRNPRAIEALGRIDVLCADKTGTLTQGRIALRSISNGEDLEELEELSHPFREILVTGLRAGPAENGNVPHLTDRAVMTAAREVGLTTGWERIGDLPFEPGRGFSAVVGIVGGQQRLCVKGAPEVILPQCISWRNHGHERKLDDERRERLARHATEMASHGYRVLAVADRRKRARAAPEQEEIRDLVFCGYFGFVDPVRTSAKESVRALQQAGVEVMMVTGDHPDTANAVARELEIIDHKRVITGPELDAITDDELSNVLTTVSVCARVTPEQKVRVVQALKRSGKVVAMTGDGANDAPAIRLADVGIALGERSTPAARNACDLLVTDGRIETIVTAVLEGRALWRAVRDSVALLVGGNLGEIAFTVVGGLVSGRSPLNARQLLLVNLLTDTAPAIALSLRAPSSATPEELLVEGPESSLGSALTRDILFRAGVATAATGGAWLVARATGTRRGADTVALLTLVGSQIGQALVLGGRDKLVLGASLGALGLLLGVVETPGLSRFFGCRPLGPLGLLQAATASLAAMGLSWASYPTVRRLWPTEKETTTLPTNVHSVGGVSAGASWGGAGGGTLPSGRTTIG